jgi:MoxR-like ATPase
MIALLRVAQGFAAISGRDYMLPDDIKKAAVPVLAHRIVFHNSFFHREDMGKTLIKSLLESVAVPSESIDFSRRYAE